MNFEFIRTSPSKKSVIILFLIISFWTLPRSLYLPASNLDSSWVVGLNLATLGNLQFGPQIAFTYGPLGFLIEPSYIDHKLWLITFFFTLFVHFLSLFCIALIMFKSSAACKEYLLVIPMLIPFHYARDYMLLFSIIILLYLLIRQRLNGRYETYIFSLVILLLAIASLIKTNILMASVIILIGFIYILRNNFRKCVYVVLSYLILVPILWALSGQNITNLPVYLSNSYQISYGYNDAMAINAPIWQVYIGIIGIVSAIIIFLYSLVKKSNNIVIFGLLNMGFLFLIFKHSFVRPGGKVYGFLDIYALFFLFIYIISKKDSKLLLGKISLLLSIFFVVSIYIGIPGVAEDNILHKLPEYKTTISLVSNQSYQIQMLNTTKNKIRNDYPLNEKIFKYIDNKTMDVFPWDIALVWAYDFNWSPRPVFQSYSAYTQYLDRLNAQHFSKGNAPQVILYSYKSIDGRYPLFDEPSTFASILQNYSYVNKSGEFLLLSYNPEINVQMNQEDLGEIETKQGQPVIIPKYDSGYVFAQIQVENSATGKFMKIIYKQAFAHIKFQFSDSTYSNEFRFIPGVAMNGVFLSKYVGNTDDLASVFTENVTQNINSIVLNFDNPSHYERIIKIKFYGLPSKRKMEYQNISVDRS